MNDNVKENYARSEVKISSDARGRQEAVHACTHVCMYAFTRLSLSIRHLQVQFPDIIYAFKCSSASGGGCVCVCVCMCTCVCMKSNGLCSEVGAY